MSAELSYQRYILKEWQYFPVTNGRCNNISLNLTLARNSTDNPIYPRQGSDFSLSVQVTPPYSLFDGVDYGSYNLSNQDDVNKMHKWVEYHKWKLKSKTYTAFTSGAKAPVLMPRAEFGILGHFNKTKKSPFETFDMGGVVSLRIMYAIRSYYALIESLATAYEDPSEVVDYYFQNERLLNNMRDLAVEEQAIDYLVGLRRHTSSSYNFV